MPTADCKDCKIRLVGQNKKIKIYYYYVICLSQQIMVGWLPGYIKSKQNKYDYFHVICGKYQSNTQNNATKSPRLLFAT
jgi:hypothetical protein